ncbi:uncharacterized protein LOC120328639 isoform X2 [Styela clava]
MGKGRRIRVFRRQLGWKNSINKAAKALKKLAKIFCRRQQEELEKDPSKGELPPAVLNIILDWARKQSKKLCVCMQSQERETENFEGDLPSTPLAPDATKSLSVCSQPARLVQNACCSGHHNKNNKREEATALCYQLSPSFSEEDLSREATPPHPFEKILRERNSLEYIERMDIEYAKIRSLDSDGSESPDYMLALSRSREVKQRPSFFSDWNRPNPFFSLPGNTPPPFPSDWNFNKESKDCLECKSFTPAASPEPECEEAKDATDEISEVKTADIEKEKTSDIQIAMVVAERMNWMLEQVDNVLGENLSYDCKITDYAELDKTDVLSISSSNSFQLDSLSVSSVDTSSEDKEEINIRELDSKATFVVDGELADATSLISTDETCEQWVDDILFGELEVVGREMMSRATYIIEHDTNDPESIIEEKSETPIQDMINEILENTKSLMKDEKRDERNLKTTKSCSKEDPEEIDQFIQIFFPNQHHYKQKDINVRASCLQFIRQQGTG